MESVDPERGLLAFKSDDLIRAFVLDNEEPGISEPFYVSDHEADEWVDDISDAVVDYSGGFAYV